MVQKLSTYRRGNTTITGITTFNNIVINSGESTGTTDQNLQVIGGSYISGNAGIGSAIPQTKLDVSGDLRLGGTTNSITINPDHEYPSIRPTLDLNFAATKTLDRRITFTRDSLGTYTDELGIIRTAPNNTPRFDHDPTTGESLGLLIEESRTNLFVESEAFNTGWSNIRSSDSGTTATADPEGNTTGAAYKLVANTDNNTHRLDRGSLSMSVSTTYTMSVWAKAAEYNGVSLTISDSSNAFNGIYFDLSNGTFTNGGNAHSGSMIAYPNGWYRCIATYTTPSSISFQQCLIGVLEDGTTKSYAGDNSSGIYIWGAQLEEGAFATSYIPTSGSTVTRAADIAKITGTNFTDFYNETEGTTVFEAKTFKNVAGNVYYGEIGDGSSNNRNIMYRNISSGNAIFYYIVGGSVQVDALSSGAPNQVNTNVVSAYAYKEDDFSVFASGGYSNTDTGGNIMTNVDSFSIGMNNTNNGEHLNGYIKRLSYYNKRLPNAQLQGLTAQ